MSAHQRLRDPTGETAATRRARLAPPASLAGKTVALLDIGKSRGSEFIDQLERRFTEHGVATRRYRKPTNTRVAPAEVIRSITAEAQVAVIALSD